MAEDEALINDENRGGEEREIQGEEKKRRRRKLRKRTIALIVAGCFLGVILLTFGGFYIAYGVTDAKGKTWLPDYERMPKEQLTELYNKPALSDEDYAAFYAQTGLTKVGVDRARERTDGFSRILLLQENYFEERETIRDVYAPLICNDRTNSPAATIFLERGDIIISSSTHFAGWRIGHAAIVTDPAHIFEATQVGSASRESNINSITDRINFMVLRIKPEYFGGDDGSYRSNLDRVTSYIQDDLKDAPYSVFTGIFTDKNKCKATMCSHLLWYGFMHFDDENGAKYALDLDPNGGALVMPKDISRSPYVELVQTFGFDPEKLYE